LVWRLPCGVCAAGMLPPAAGKDNPPCRHCFPACIDRASRHANVIAHETATQEFTWSPVSA